MPVDHSFCGLSAEILIPHLLSSASWPSSSVVVYLGNAVSLECTLSMNVHQVFVEYELRALGDVRHRLILAFTSLQK